MRNRSIISNRIFRIIVVVILMFPLLANSERKPNLVGPTRIYVDTDATGSNNGTDWTNAYVHLQDALDVTNANGSTDYEIWVAEGVYYPDEENIGIDHTDNDQTESFRIEYNNLRMYGGFSGVEISREQRDWESNPTILSGDITGNDTNTDGNNIAEDWNDILGNNAFHVVFLDGETNTDITSYYTRVDGFTITAGQADATGVTPFGGGILCAAGTTGVCSPTLRNLTIQGNRAQYGGGIILSMNHAGVSSPLMVNVSLIGNLATDDGGGFYSWLANDAAGESSPALVNVSFRNNYAGRWGGGMRITANDGTNSPTLTNVEFYGNEAADYGGGMSVQANIDSTIQPILTNVTFSGNTAVAGGGLHTIKYAPSTFGMELNNSILWGNIGTSGFPEIYNQSSSPVITSSDIEGCGGSGASWVATCGTDNGGNIDLDPQFENPGAGDLSLQGTSPAIDAGNLTLLPLDVTDLDEDGNTAETLPLDLALNNRVEDCNVDMGAYEKKLVFSTISPIADFDGDGDTDVSVFRPSNGRWYMMGQPSVSWALTGDLPVPGDYNGDGTTDIAVYRPSNGKWYIKDQGSTSWGFSGDIPVQADYDGDGSTEIAVLRPSNGRWYIEGMGNFSWYHSGDIPVPCDYDGDGADEIAVFRPSNNKWYVMGSSPVSWAQSGDIPVPADYDGDGSCDIAVYRPSNGNWYVQGNSPVSWGYPDDIPVPGDYDGDGATEIAILRPSNGRWYIQGVGNFSWYFTGDYPLPVRDTNADGDVYE